MAVNGSTGDVAFTKFVFLSPPASDETTLSKLRAIGSHVGRGFFNEYDIEGPVSMLGVARDGQAYETMQFLIQDTMPFILSGDASDWMAQAKYVVQISSKYRPRLEEVESELRRRVADAAQVRSIDGVLRGPRYSSAELQQYLSKTPASRRNGRVSRNAIIFPLRKRREWWQQSALERHMYFYPHLDRTTGVSVKGHALAAEPGIPALVRRLYHNPDGYQRAGEYDFIAYFECSDEGLPVFDRVCKALRDPLQNPEWRFVEEGPVWRGKRVLRW
jgi:hypothetical protein